MGKIITRIPIDNDTVIYISELNTNEGTITYYECIDDSKPQKITTVLEISEDEMLFFDNYYLTPDLIKIIEKNLEM